MAKRTFTSEYFAEHGRRGGRIGGKKAAANMTAKERSERARKGGKARWNKKVEAGRKKVAD
jgi:hypothetical protein